jgi:hypothetical protein
VICVPRGIDSNLGVIVRIIKSPMEVLVRSPCGSGPLDVVSPILSGGGEENHGTRKSALCPIQEILEYKSRVIQLKKTRLVLSVSSCMHLSSHF